MRLSSIAALVLIVAASADAARVSVPEPQHTSRLESPRTDAPVQADSIFAPVVAAVPLTSDDEPRTRPAETDGLPVDAGTFSLDGTWRFQLESTSCTEDEDACEGLEEEWYARTYDDSGWRELAVPGHFTRQIPIDELGGRASTLPFNFAWYRRRFTLPAEIDPARQRLRLLFEAVDYRADVWLDGGPLNDESHLGTFNPFAFDLPAALAPGEHVLAVRVQKPLDPGILSCGDGGGPGTDLKTVVDGTKGYWDGRPGGNDDNFDAVTKQSMHTGGIVRSVSVTASGPVRLDWVFVTAQPSGRKKADVLLSYTLTNLTGAPRDVVLSTAFAGRGLARRTGLQTRVTLQPGPNRVDLETTLTRVRFWYPAGHPEVGGPEMYTATTTVVDGAGVLARVSDRRVDRFGIRALGFTSDRCEERFGGEAPEPVCADRFDYTAPRPPQGTAFDRPVYQHFVNGKRLFLRGVGGDPDAWAASIDRAAADRFVGLVRGLDANHLGVAVQIAPPVFYDATDDAGVAVVQDFELQWTYNDVGVVWACTDTANGSLAVPTGARNDDVAAALIEDASLIAADMVYLLYNHPSIIQWVMHNEPGWELAEILREYLPIIQIVSSYNRVLDRRLVDLATGIDATRSVKAAAGVGDTHIYSGFLLCEIHDLVAYDPTRTLCNAASTAPAPFPSEFGTEMWPFSAKRWMPPDLLFPADRATRRQTWTDANPRNRNEVVPWLREWTYHTSQPEVIATYVGSPADFDRFQDYAFATQLYQRAFLKFYIEHYRRDRFRPTAGLRLFHLRASWDLAHFDLFDQYDLPSASVSAVRAAYGPLLVTSQIPKPRFAPGETMRLPIWIVNDRLRTAGRATLSWSIAPVEDAWVLRGVQDFDGPPWIDARRAFLNRADALPAFPVITTLPRLGAAEGEPIVSGRRAVRIAADSVSPREGTVTLDFTAPTTPDVVRHYLLRLNLRRGRRSLATNEHLITVADPSWSPPPGLSDGVTAYGTDPAEKPLAFALEVQGAGAGFEVALETTGFGGAPVSVATATADGGGTALFTGLTPDDYVVRAGSTEARLALTEDTTVTLDGRETPRSRPAPARAGSGPSRGWSRTPSPPSWRTTSAR